MDGLLYFFSTFPSITTTFIQREVKAVTSSGIRLTLVSNRAPRDGEYHPSDFDLLNQTYFLALTNPLIYAWANLKFILKTPSIYLRCIRLAVKLQDKFPYQRVRNLVHLAGAAVLAAHCEKNKIAHVHVHFALGAASVAIFLHELTGIPFSISIHGSDVLLPRPLTEEKLFYLSHQPVVRSNMGKNGRKLCEKKFDIRLNTDRLVKIFRENIPALSA